MKVVRGHPLSRWTHSPRTALMSEVLRDKARMGELKEVNTNFSFFGGWPGLAAMWGRARTEPWMLLSRACATSRPSHSQGCGLFHFARVCGMERACIAPFCACCCRQRGVPPQQRAGAVGAGRAGRAGGPGLVSDVHRALSSSSGVPPGAAPLASIRAAGALAGPGPSMCQLAAATAAPGASCLCLTLCSFCRLALQVLLSSHPLGL